MTKNFLNLEEQQNRISGSKFTVILLKGEFAYWWSYFGKGLRLQPAQQACFEVGTNSFFLLNISFR